MKGDRRGGEGRKKGQGEGGEEREALRDMYGKIF